MEEKNLSYVITQRPLSVGTLKHLKNSLKKKKMGNDFLKSLIFRARTTCRVGVGSAGWFWQRPGKVGSGKETEVGLPLSYLQFFQLWVYFQLYFQNMSCFNI